MYMELVDAVVAAAPDPVSGVRDAFAGAAEVLRQTDYEDACPIATVALEVASSNERLRVATADVFESWIERATGWMTSAGVEAARSRELAIVFIQLLEGAFLLCRAARSTEAMDVAGAVAVELVSAALDLV
jgi:hypothetical protein